MARKSYAELATSPFVTEPNNFPFTNPIDADSIGRNQCTRKGCNWTFLTVEELKVHMQVVHKAYPYVCSHCNKVFGSRAGLWYHEAEHKGKFRFICELCNKGFNRKEQFTTHFNTCGKQ